MKYSVIYEDPCWRYRNVKTGGSHTSGSAQKYPTLSTEAIRQLPVKTIAAKDAVLFLWATTPLGVDPYTVMDAHGFTFKTKLYWHKTERLGTGYWLRGEVEELLIGTRGAVKAWRSSQRNWVNFEDAIPGDPLLDVAHFAANLMCPEPYVYPDTEEGRVRMVQEAAHKAVREFKETQDGACGLALPTEGHSHKPAAFHRLIESLTPGVQRVELFATEHSRSCILEGPRILEGHAVGSWDCFGLELGHNFCDPEFWEGFRETCGSSSVNRHAR